MPPAISQVFFQFYYFLVGFLPTCTSPTVFVGYKIIVGDKYCLLMTIGGHTAPKKYTTYDSIACIIVRYANSTLPCSMSYSKKNSFGKVIGSMIQN